MGSGREPHEDRAEPLGAWLARQGVHLLTGGGRGAMACVSRAFFEAEDRQGLVIGVLPKSGEPGETGPPEGYPNPWVEIAIHTHLPARGAQGDTPQSRNHINILSADAVLVLPGGLGTASEARLALSYGRPVAAFIQDRRSVAALPDQVPLVPTLDEVDQFLRRNVDLAPKRRSGSAPRR